MRLLIILSALVLFSASVDSAPSPFFDAIYDALNGNGRRSYGYGNGYSGYGSGYSGYNNGYNGYGNYGYRPSYNVQRERPSRQEKSYKDLCRVHHPDSIGVPGAGGILCPY